MEKAYAYARYSSDRQNEASIDAQLRAIRAYAEQHGISVVGEYVDEAISGKGAATARRTGYQRMLRDCRRGEVSVVLVHKYDRVARNIGEHVNLEQKLNGMGCSLIAVEQPVSAGPEGKILKALLWSMSEYYIDNLAQETRKGHREAALKGLHNGGVAPFGYKIVDQKYVIDEIEADYVRRFYSAALRGESFAPLVEEMALAGVKGHRGAAIRYPQIYEILRSERYCGVYCYTVGEQESREARRQKVDAIRVENAIPAIVGRDEWNEVQKIMSGRKHAGRRSDYLCSGLVYCSCGAKMHGTTTHRKGHEYRRFYCSAKCGQPGIDMDTVDAAAREYLSGLLDPAAQDLIAAALREYRSGESDRKSEFRAALKRRIREKEQERQNLIANMTAAVLPASVLQSLAGRLEELNVEIDTLSSTEPPEDCTASDISAWLGSIRAAEDDSAIKLLIGRIDIKNATVEGITSTVARIIGCGGSLAIFPAILFGLRRRA